MPGYLFYTGEEVEVAGEDEEIIGKSVYIAQKKGIDILAFGKAYDKSFRTATYCTRHMCLGT